MLAANNITAAIATDMTMNNASTVNGGNDITIQTGNDMLMNNTTTVVAGNDVDIDAGGGVLVSNDTITAGNDVFIDAVDNITLGKIVAANDVRLTSTSGGILDNNGWDINITARRLFMDVAGSIGGAPLLTGIYDILNPDNWTAACYADFLNTDVDYMEGIARKGSIFVHENNDLTTGDMTATNAAGISIISLGSDSGDLTLGDFTADIVHAWAYGSDGDSSIFDIGDINAQYFVALAANNIGTALNPINTNVDTIIAHSFDTGSIFINDNGNVELGLLLTGTPTGDLGASVSANNGTVNVTSDGDMVVNSVVSPRGGVYLESTNGSIYAGDSWCPHLTNAEFAAIFGALPVAAQNRVKMDLAGTEWATDNGMTYFSHLVRNAAGLPDGPNVIAGGYSYFTAPNGTIGVGNPAGAPGVAGDATPAVYNPLKVCIQVLQANQGTAANPAGNNSALPANIYGANIPPAGLTLMMGGAVPSGYHDGVHGARGISGAISGIVRPGVPANFYTNDVTPAVVTAPGYVFYDDVNNACCDPFNIYTPATYAAPIGVYNITRQIYPIIPGLAAFDLGSIFAIIGDALKFRIPKKGIVDSFQIAQTQGPISLAAGQVYFYHPLVEIGMYEMPPLGLDMYEFIGNSINATNPALLPILADDDEEEGWI